MTMTATGRLAADVECLQPLVVIDGALYGVGRGGDAAMTLVSALGIPHPLRPVASARVWREHSARLRHDEFLRGVVGRISEARGVPDQVAYFLTVLVPRVTARDWGGAAARPVEKPAARHLPVPPLDLADLARAAPVPTLPEPAMVASGRVWRLARQAGAAAIAGVHVAARGDMWSLTGDYLPVRVIEERWRAAFDEAVGHAARLCLERGGDTASFDHAGALDELRRTGAVRRGALLLFGTTPPTIGHLMPRHHNASLGRQVTDDVALATPFHVGSPDAGGGGLIVMGRSPQGTWSPLALPSGICLGRSAPARPAHLEADVAAVAFLRWAAVHIATNGKFHEHD